MDHVQKQQIDLALLNSLAQSEFTFPLTIIQEKHLVFNLLKVPNL